MSALTLSYSAGAEQRLVRAVRTGSQWLVTDELDDDKRIVERVDDGIEADAIARDYAAQADAAGHPLVEASEDA